MIYYTRIILAKSFVELQITAKMIPPTQQLILAPCPN